MVRKLLQDPENSSKDVVELVGDSGRIWGAVRQIHSFESSGFHFSYGASSFGSSAGDAVES